MPSLHRESTDSLIYLIVHHTCCVQSGDSSLMMASGKGHVEMVDNLLQHGARVDLQSKVCITF